MNDLLLIPVIFLAVGGILILLWRIFLIASGLFLIGFVSFLFFVEGYGIYLLFTEPNLYIEELSQNVPTVLQDFMRYLIYLCLYVVF